MNVSQFLALVPEVLGRSLQANHQQAACVEHDPEIPLLIAAGPGTGKTTVLVQRALRLLLVDHLLPEQILITTFTKKAAREIRTRLITWGGPLIDAAKAREASPTTKAFLESIDINQFRTGTLDSICEDALANATEPDQRPPVVTEAFAADLILNRQGRIYEERSRLGGQLGTYLAPYVGGDNPPQSIGDLTRAIRLLVDRFRHDEVDIRQYLEAGPHLAARQSIVRIYQRYTAYLSETNRMDFPALEQAVRDQLRDGILPEFMKPIQAVLVDEYQDTNLLQEQLYFELVRRTNASLSVVGDDDQSLYRFRGATMELFKNFTSRANDQLKPKRAPQILFLTENYRSTPEIVSFFNEYVEYDADFRGARVQPPKPPIAEVRPSNNVPVLGIFRDTPEELATAVAEFLAAIFRGDGWQPSDGQSEPIYRDPQLGDLGDVVLISHTVAEHTGRFGMNAPKPRFTYFLRQELAARNIECFNPRGQLVKYVEDVEAILGLVLECIDPSSAQSPNGPLATALPLTREAKATFLQWRLTAAALVAQDSRTTNQRGDTLKAVMTKWRRLTQEGKSEANDWPVLDIIYGFLPWIRSFQDDPEHQIYLEAITRCVAEAGTVSAYRASILRRDEHRVRSIEAALRDVLAPIADELIDSDEEILASIPRTMLNVMTIHQAKGLEYPLVLVDVSSSFSMNHRLNAFRRFPSEASSTTRLEDDLAPYTSIGDERLERSALQRSFDDLVRLYYVAYSRAQSVLVLIGCSKSLRYLKPVKHVGQGWRRDHTWAWRKDPIRTKGAPVFADGLPFVTVDRL